MWEAAPKHICQRTCGNMSAEIKPRAQLSFPGTEINTVSKRNQRRWSLFHLQVIKHHQGKPSQDLKQKLRDRDWHGGHGETLPPGLLAIACSACFLIWSWTVYRWVTPPPGGWAILHQLLLKKKVYWLAQRAIWGGQVSSGVPSSLMTSVCDSLQSTNQHSLLVFNLKHVPQLNHRLLFPDNPQGPILISVPNSIA